MTKKSVQVQKPSALWLENQRLKKENELLRGLKTLEIATAPGITHEQARDIAVYTQHEAVKRTANDAVQFMNERLVPYFQAAIRFQRVLHDINEFIGHPKHQEKQLRFGLEGKDRELTDALTDLAAKMRAMTPNGGLPDNFESLYEYCGRRVEGIQLFIGGHISDQQLKEIRFSDARPEVKDFIDSLESLFPTAGRTQDLGRYEATRRWHIRQDTYGADQAAVEVMELRKELEQEESDGIITEAGREALAYLKTIKRAKASNRRWQCFQDYPRDVFSQE